MPARQIPDQRVRRGESDAVIAEDVLHQSLGIT